MSSTASSSSQPAAAAPQPTPPPVRRPWWKTAALRLALLSASVLLMLGAAEIGVRMFSDVSPPLIEADPVIGKRYLPSFEGDVYVPEAKRKVRLRFNELGFRGPDRPRQKPEGVRRVAILGDSMIASLAVDERDTLVCQLEAMLNASRPEHTWEVLNFGVSGASPGQALALYRELVSQWAPDIVLCAYFVGNDFADNSRQLSNNPRIYFDLDDDGNLQQAPFSAKRTAVSRWLNRYSRFYVWQKLALNRARHQVLKHTKTLAPGDWIFCREQTESLQHAWQLSGAILQQFEREVVDRGALFSVVVIPVSQQVYQDAFEKIRQRADDKAEQFDWDYPDRQLVRLCREAGVPVLTMTDAFRQAAPSASLKAKDEWLYHLGTGHFNERGNRLAAEEVHRYLTESSADAQVAQQPLVTRVR